MVCECDTIREGGALQPGGIPFYAADAYAALLEGRNMFRIRWASEVVKIIELL